MCIKSVAQKSQTLAIWGQDRYLQCCLGLHRKVGCVCINDDFSIKYDPETEHIRFLGLALQEAGKCKPSPLAFSVGCVITVQWPASSSNSVVLANGYSRELSGNTHAEANALTKARALSPQDLADMFPSAEPDSLLIETLLSYASVYTTMEPCSIRTSGLAPCADALIAAKVKHCFIGVGEPPDFVNCEGAKRLKDASIEVVWLSGLEDECLRVARRGH